MEEGFKACQFCAEPIREAATVCRHCDRSVVPTAPVVNPSPPKTVARKLLVVGLVAVIAVAAIALASRAWSPSVFRSSSTPCPPVPAGSIPSLDCVTRAAAGDTTVPSTPQPAPPRKIEIPILSGNLIVLARDSNQIPFTIPANAIKIGLVRGEFHAFGGEGNDIQAIITNPSEFENWSNGHQAQGYYFSPGKVTNGTIDLKLPPGDYILGFSNRFAAVSRKEVTGQITLTYFVPGP